MTDLLDKLRLRLALLLLDMAMWLLWPDARKGVIKRHWYQGWQWIELLPDGFRPDVPPGHEVDLADQS